MRADAARDRFSVVRHRFSIWCFCGGNLIPEGFGAIPLEIEQIALGAIGQHDARINPERVIEIDVGAGVLSQEHELDGPIQWNIDIHSMTGGAGVETVAPESCVLWRE